MSQHAMRRVLAWAGRHFRIVEFLFLLLAAYGTAGVINAWAAGQLMAVPPPPELDRHADTPVDDPSAGATVDADLNAREVLISRRVFNITPPPPPPPPKPEPAVVPPEPASEDDPELKPTELPIDLVGTIVPVGGESVLATVNVDGDVRMLGEGATVLGGKATVVEIGTRYILLAEKDTAVTVVHLWDEPRNARSRRGKSKRPDSARSRARKMRAAVKRLGSNRYRVDRRAFFDAAGDAKAFTRDARIAAHSAGDGTRGFKLLGVKRDGIWQALGLRSGDIVTAVGGRNARGVSDWRRVNRALRRQSTLKLTVQRRGRPVHMSYRMK